MLERLVVQDAAADLLSRPRLQGLMAALIDQDCTMAELAGGSGMSYSLLSHHLRRLVSLGLVRVVGHAARAGRASPMYRATARSYFIDAAWCKALPGESLTRDLREALQATRRPKGLLLYSENGPRMRLVLDNPRPDASEFWLRLRLSPSAARQFNEELRALFERWREQQEAQGAKAPKRATYLAHGACARVD